MSATVTLTSLAQRNPFAAADAPTLAMVLAHLDGLDPALQPGLADLRSAVRRVAQLLALPSEAVPAHPGFLRPRLDPGRCRRRMACGRHAGPTCAACSARRCASPASTCMPGRYLAPLAPPWQQLAEPLPKAFKVPLSRLDAVLLGRRHPALGRRRYGARPTS